jgi:hypothetical protein
MNLFEVLIQETKKDNRRPYILGSGDCRNYKEIIRKKIQNQRSNLEAQNLVNELKCAIGCEDCGWNEIPSILDFHHIKKDPKNRKLSKCNSLRQVVRELPKGVFLCRNCHAKRHYDPNSKRVHYNKDEFR